MRHCHAILALLVALGARHVLASPEVPGAAQSRPVALIGATLHPVSGPALSGILLFDQGKIAALGDAVPLPDNAEQIDCSGRHIYPGLIDAYTHLGLTEIESVRSTLDQAEVGEINPNVKSQVAFNPDSELIPVTRSGGVLSVLCAPQGGLISGCSSVMLLDGWTWEEMTLQACVGLHINWPRMSAVDDWRVQTSAADQLQARDQALKELKSTLENARAYQRGFRGHDQDGSPAPEFDARWHAMLPVMEGKLPVFVVADEIEQIQSAVALAREQGWKLVIIGGYDAALCAPLLREQDVSVIVGGVHRLPMRKHDPYDAPFTLPARLHEAQVRFCLSAAEAASNTRNLAHHAGMAAAFGLPTDEALRSVTLSAATILGVADRMGSLETGKDATLIVTDGDPLEITTHVTDAFIQGRRVDLSDRQKRLWAKYKEKYRRLGIQQE